MIEWSTGRLTDGQTIFHGDPVMNIDFAVVFFFNVVATLMRVLDLDESSSLAGDAHLLSLPAHSGLSACVSYTQREVRTCKWLGNSTRPMITTPGGVG